MIIKETLENMPIDKQCELLISKAHQLKASDIHFENYKNNCRIRFRIDGLLQEAAGLPLMHNKRLISKLKTMANLDISEQRLPQDGRCQFQIDQKAIDTRISTCPTINQEKLVLRLLKTENKAPEINELGMTKEQQVLFKENINKAQGLILVTGPTGSGKTITLYSALQHINSIHKNISTIEDPVEVPLPGINQININPKINLNFSNILRTLLRQDPDIIMIGEIRDAETAEIAFKAAQTGHLVLATLHSNSAIDTIARLNHLSIKNHHIANTVNLIIAQRLLRKTCVSCSGKGCDACQQGHSGRSGVFELLDINPQVSKLISKSKAQKEIAEEAEKSGFISMKQIAQQLLVNKTTSKEEIERVLS